MNLNTQCNDIEWEDICICYVAICALCRCWLRRVCVQKCTWMRYIYGTFTSVCAFEHIGSPPNKSESFSPSVLLYHNFFLSFSHSLSLSLPINSFSRSLIFSQFDSVYVVYGVRMGPTLHTLAPTIHRCVNLLFAENNIQCNFPFMQIWKSIFGLCMLWIMQYTYTQQPTLALSHFISCFFGLHIYRLLSLYLCHSRVPIQCMAVVVFFFVHSFVLKFLCVMLLLFFFRLVSHRSHRSHWTHLHHITLCSGTHSCIAT